MLANHVFWRLMLFYTHCCSCCNLQCCGFLLLPLMMQNHRQSEFCANLMYCESDLILGDPGAVSRAGLKGATKVFKHRRKSPWVPTLTGPFPNGQKNAGSWLGTENALYYCAQSANSFSRVLFLSSYTTAIIPPQLPHPRRPRSSQSGREKRRNESFQVRAKEPLGTDSHRIISKNSSKCRLLIGHKKCFVLLCPISEQFLLSSFREFVHDSYCLATLARFVHHASVCKGNLYFLLSYPETKELPMSRKNVWDAISRSNSICPENIPFLTHHNIS